MNESFGRRTPWGDEDARALVTEVETVLERQLQELIMRGCTTPTIRQVKTAKALAERGTLGDELYLLLNGVLVVEVDGSNSPNSGPEPFSASAPPSKEERVQRRCVRSPTARSLLCPLVQSMNVHCSS